MTEWRSYGPGERVPCPGTRDLLGRRKEPRGTPGGRRSGYCGRVIYNQVGDGLLIKVRVAYIGRGDPLLGRCPIPPQRGMTMRFCSDCKSWIEVWQIVNQQDVA